MKSISFKNNDLFIDSSTKRLGMITDLEQKMQRTRTCLLTVLGELFYNANAGLDYAEVLSVKEKNTSLERKKQAITQAIMKDSNVEKVANITIKNDDLSRKITIDLQLKYKYENTTTTIGGVTVG